MDRPMRERVVGGARRVLCVVLAVVVSASGCGGADATGVPVASRAPASSSESGDTAEPDTANNTTLPSDARRTTNTNQQSPMTSLHRRPPKIGEPCSVATVQTVGQNIFTPL